MTFMHCTPQEVLAYRQQMPIRDNSNQDMQPDAQARLASRMMDEQYARDARIRSQEYRQNMTGNAFSVLLSTFANRINNRGSYGGGYGRGGGYYSSGGSSGGYYPSTGGYNSSYYGYNSQHDRGRVGNGYCSDGTYRPQC